MAAQILYNLEDQPDVSDENLENPYTDVDGEAWYAEAVYWARLHKVAEGDGDGTFLPGYDISREEFAQMLYNYAKYMGCDLTAQGYLIQFPDGDSVQEWALPALTWANGSELLSLIHI